MNSDNPGPRRPPPDRPSPQDEQRFVRQVDWNLFGQFFEIVQAGSLSAAGRRLNLQQPSVSAALKRLEDRLGVTLCHRSATGIRLTPAGRALLTLCTDMMESVRMVPHLTSRAAGQIEGVLSIRMVSHVVCAEFDDGLASFHRRHPSVEIRLDIAPWRGVLDSLARGGCEIGVTFDSVPREHFVYEPLFRETQQLYCGARHPLWGQRFRDPVALADQAFVLTQDDEPEDLTRFRHRYNLGLHAVGHAEDLHEVARLLRLGIGVGFLPTVVADPEPHDRLWPLLAVPLLPSYLVYLVTQPTKRLTTPAQLFVDELRRRLRARDA